MAGEKPSSRAEAWFCTSGLPSDVVIEVGDMTFHLHKFPLMSKSRKLQELITAEETKGSRVQVSDSEYECHISLADFPGGSETFEAAAKFCYGVKMELSSSNVAPLRCAGEFLEMTDDYSEDNLISKTERFLSHSVFKSLKESIKTLNSCDRLMPMAETLGIVDKCIDSIAATASHSDPSLFGWPLNDAPPRDTCFQQLALLSLPLFKRLIAAMKTRHLIPQIMETCLIYYAKRYIPGISRSTFTRKPSSSSVLPSDSEQRDLLETIISNLPQQNTTTSSTAIRILFGLLRTAYILNASDACRAALEKKIGSQLEQATLDDLVIPSYSYLNETLYDVDCVERILAYFLQERSASTTQIQSAALMLVGKLIDGYLSEIASDANLKPEKFCQLATALPEEARVFDDGLYRSVDVYLKAHPWLSEAEREKICGLMDCQKLTLEACTHAAQNERLPLRAVVEVLFFEQLQLRQAIAGTLLATEGDSVRPLIMGREEQEDNGSTWRGTVRENQMLRLDMDSTRSRVHYLERQCSTIKKAIAKIDKVGEPSHTRGGWRTKFGCKFKTQVCDSHQATTVVDSRIITRK